MNTTDHVPFQKTDRPALFATCRPALAPARYELVAPVRGSILRARHYLIGEQRMDGSWSGRKSGDVNSLSQIVLLLAYLGRERSELAVQAACAIELDQQPLGGWSLSPGGPIDLAASVLAYFALKVVGQEASQPHLSRARRAIRELGGADAANASTRFWLALLGQIDYRFCSLFAPEWLLMPARNHNLMPKDERRLAALSVVWARRPRCDIELSRGVRELFLEQPQNWPTPGEWFPPQASVIPASFWLRCEQFGFVPFRKRALERANFLLAEAAVELSTTEVEIDELAWQWIALLALGHRSDSRVLTACESRLEQLAALNADSDEGRSQPETSLTADTALAVEALHRSGMRPEQPSVAAGLSWLVEHRLLPAQKCDNAREQVAMLRTCMNLSEHCDDSLPPDMQLTAQGGVQRGLATIGENVPTVLFRELTDALCEELLARQQYDGGWSPWTGSKALAAPSRILVSAGRREEASSPDATGNTLELLARREEPSLVSSMRRAIAYLRSSQRGDGSWDSASGARFLHGTMWAVRGLIAAGVDEADPAVAAGLNWIFAEQQESGGWGETVARTGKDFVAADASAIQTAWALLALIAAGHADHDATRRGIQFLLDMQLETGCWSDLQVSVRDSASGAWYRNDLHSAALPLLALARWLVPIGQHSGSEKPTSLRLICNESTN